MHERTLNSPLIQSRKPVRDLLSTPAGLLVQHDDAAALFEATTGRLLRRLETGPLGHGRRSLALHPDRKSAVVVTSDRIARFDLETGELLASEALEGGRGVAVSPDGKLAFATARRGEVTLLLSWDLGRGDLREVARLGPDRDAVGLAAEPDGRHLWVALSTELHRLDLRTKDSWQSLRDRDGRLGQPVVLAAAATLAVGTKSASVQLWSLRKPGEVKEVKVGATVAHPVLVAPLRGGRYFAASEMGQRVLVLAPGDEAPRAQLSGPHSAVTALAADAEETLWIGAEDGTVWTLRVEDELLSLGAPKKASAKAPKPVALPLHPTPHVTAVAVVDSQRAVSADLDGAVLSWRRGSDVAVAARKGRAGKPGASPNAIHLIGVAGEHLVVRDGGAAFAVFEVDTLQRKGKLSHRGALLAVGVGGGHGVVTAGGKTLKSWSTESWEQTGEIVGPGSTIEALELAAGGEAIFARDNRGVGFFHAADLRPITRRSFADIEVITASAADPTRLRAALAFVDRKGKPRVRIWDVEALEALTLDVVARAPSFVAAGLIVQSGDALALYGTDGARRWSVALRELLDAPEVHLAAVDPNYVALVAGGRLSVVAAATGAVVQRHVIDQQFLQVAFAGGELVCTTTGGRVLWLKAQMTA